MCPVMKATAPVCQQRYLAVAGWWCGDMLMENREAVSWQMMPCCAAGHGNQYQMHIAWCSMSCAAARS